MHSALKIKEKKRKQGNKINKYEIPENYTRGQETYNGQHLLIARRTPIHVSVRKRVCETEVTCTPRVQVTLCQATGNGGRGGGS